MIRIRKLTPTQQFILDTYVFSGDYDMETEGIDSRLFNEARIGRTFVEMSREAWEAARTMIDTFEEDYIENIVLGAQGWGSTIAREEFAERQARKAIEALLRRIDAALAEQAAPTDDFVMPPPPVADPTPEHPNRIFVGTSWGGQDWYVYDGNWAKAAQMYEKLVRGLKRWHEMRRRDATTCYRGAHYCSIAKQHG